MMNILRYNPEWKGEYQEDICGTIEMSILPELMPAQFISDFYKKKK